MADLSKMIEEQRFKELRVKVPENKDSDVIIEMPNGQELTVQFRPSYADVRPDGKTYPGSLDIILPQDMPILAWKGDDMEDAPKVDSDNMGENYRLCKQLVGDLPWGTD